MFFSLSDWNPVLAHQIGVPYNNLTRYDDCIHHSIALNYTKWTVQFGDLSPCTFASCVTTSPRRLASVLSHIGAVHSHQSGFSVLCGIDGCPMMYRNYHSFRCHIKQKHPSACDDCDSHTESNVTDMQTIGGENGPEDLFGESFGDPLNQSTSWCPYIPQQSFEKTSDFPIWPHFTTV